LEGQLDKLHSQLLRFTWFVLLGAGIPYYAWQVFYQTKSAELSAGMWSVGAGLACLLLGAASSRLSLFVRKWLVVAGATATAAGSIVVDGPTLGVGLILASAVLVAATFLGPKAAYGAAGVLMAMVLSLAFAAHGLGPSVLSTGLYLSPAAWERTAFTTVVCLLSLAHIFSLVIRRLLALVSKETVLRLRERQMEADRAQVLSSAAAIQRLESLGRLAGGVAHDFNNALVVIQCGVSELRAELGPDGPQDVLDDLHRGIERAAATAKQLLSFARRNVEEVGSCEPKMVVESLVRDAERILPAHVHLESELDDVGEVAMAASSLEQVLLNLIFNSRDAMPEGGKIQIRLRKAALDRVSIEIRDTGSGMDEATRVRAFDPFFTTKGEQGTGLGLAMVWGALNRVGGGVKLESKPSEGTQVTLTIPFAERASSSSIRLQLPELQRSNLRQKILLLEDEPQVQRAIERILIQGGYEVVSVARVAEARAALSQDTFGVLITDGIVPDGGVGEFLEEFRRKMPGAPAIVCSGYVEEDLAIAGISSGRFAFLAKPFEPEDLLRLVREQIVSAGRRALARQLAEINHS